MRRMQRLAVLAVLLAAAPVLAGCEDFDTDKFDIFHLGDKKKLPGERKELFPGGVPGVTQGVPPEYLKGNQPSPETGNADEALPPAAKVNPGDEDASAALKPKAETAAVEPEIVETQAQAEAEDRRGKARAGAGHHPAGGARAAGRRGAAAVTVAGEPAAAAAATGAIAVAGREPDELFALAGSATARHLLALSAATG